METCADRIEEAQNLLLACRFSGDRSREKAERAIDLLETTPLTELDRFYLGQRGLVVFPDLLNRFLRLRPELELDDYESMVARCIEYKLDEEPSDWHQESLKMLLEHHHSGATLQLLPGKYRIDPALYEQARKAQVRDLFYEGISRDPSLLRSPEQKEEAGQYGGYRAAYHLLLHGGPRRKELIDWWNYWNYDCTYDAACDFFGTQDLIEIEEQIRTGSI